MLEKKGYKETCTTVIHKTSIATLLVVYLWYILEVCSNMAFVSTILLTHSC